MIVVCIILLKNSFSYLSLRTDLFEFKSDKFFGQDVRSAGKPENLAFSKTLQISIYVRAVVYVPLSAEHRASKTETYTGQPTCFRSL